MCNYFHLLASCGCCANTYTKEKKYFVLASNLSTLVCNHLLVGSLFTKEEQKKKYLILLPHMKALFWRHWCTETAGNSRVSLTVEFWGFLQTLIFTKQNPKKIKRKPAVSLLLLLEIYIPFLSTGLRKLLRFVFPLKNKPLKNIYKKYKALYTFSAELTSVQARNSK